MFLSYRTHTQHSNLIFRATGFFYQLFRYIWCFLSRHTRTHSCIVFFPFTQIPLLETRPRVISLLFLSGLSTEIRVPDVVRGNAQSTQTHEYINIKKHIKAQHIINHKHHFHIHIYFKNYAALLQLTYHLSLSSIARWSSLINSYGL